VDDIAERSNGVRRNGRWCDAQIHAIIYVEPRVYSQIAIGAEMPLTWSAPIAGSGHGRTALPQRPRRWRNGHCGPAPPLHPRRYI